MPTLSEIREKYPEYDRVDDQTLADALYKKHYSHAPREKFNEAIGFKPQEEQENFIFRAPRALAAGLLEGARNIGNLPHALHLPYAPHFEETNFREMVGLPGEATGPEKVTETVGQFLPGLLAPEANLGRAGEAISQIPKVGKLLKSTIGNALYPSAYAATQTEDHRAKEAGKTAATTIPFTALMQGIANQNPYLRLGSRLGLGGLGAAIGYGTGEELGLSGAAKGSSTLIGALLGLVGKSPTKESKRDIAKGIEGTNYKEKLAASERLGLDYLTPAEASANPYLGAMQGNIGKTESGSKALYEAGTKRIQSEEKAIDKLLDTVFNKEKHSPEVTRLYKESSNTPIPTNALEEIKNNEIYMQAKKNMEGKTAYKEALKDIPQDSIAYQDLVNRSLGDMIESAVKSGNKNEARLMKQVQTKLVNELDTIEPKFKQARSLAEREKARGTIEKAFNSRSMIGTNLFRALQNKKNFNELMHHLRNVPEAQTQLKDMKLVFGDLINPPTVRTAAGTTKAGMNQERNTKKAYAEMIKQVLSFGKNDKSMVDLITNPKWEEELKKINELSGYEKKLIAGTRLLGRVTAAANSEPKKPMELLLTKAIKQKP
jgi:hypothetical protein